MLEARGALKTAPAFPRAPEPDAQEDDVDDCEGKADLQQAALVAHMRDRDDWRPGRTRTPRARIAVKGDFCLPKTLDGPRLRVESVDSMLIRDHDLPRVPA
jgi:hypothetical protein